MKMISDSRCTEYSRPGHPERPQRVAKTVERLREQKEPGLDWLAPLAVSEEALLRAHSRSHLDHVHESTHDFDADTPTYPRIYEHALRSVGGAMHAFETGSGRPARL